VTTSWSIPNSPPGGPQASVDSINGLAGRSDFEKHLAAVRTDSREPDWSMIPAMTMIDPEQESRRLAEVYSSQSDGELAQVAGQISELTDLAREALRAELGKRGMYIGPLPEPADSKAPEFRDLVPIRTFWNLLEAELAKGLLESAGIEAFLFDDNMVRLDWFNANALGGVKLRVDADQVEEATRILEENASADAPPEDEDSLA
jgi:hypothetical protein